MERRVLQVLRFRLTYAEPTVFLGYFLHLTCNTHDQTVRSRTNAGLSRMLQTTTVHEATH